MHPRIRTTVLTGAVAGLTLVALSGCGSSGGTSASTPSATASSPSSTSASASTSASTDADAKVVDVTMTGSKVSPAPDTIEVDKGTKMQVTVTRDSAGEIHVHGYDLEEQAKAGVPVTFTFVADQQGVFEVEAHDPDLLLFKLQVN